MNHSFFSTLAILDCFTQRDLFDEDGANPLFRPEKCAEALKQVFEFQKKSGIPVISLVKGAAPGGTPNPADWKPHCLAGSRGKAKLPWTMIPRQTIARPTTPPERWRAIRGQFDQYIYENLDFDLTENDPLIAFIKSLAKPRLLVVGGPWDRIAGDWSRWLAPIELWVIPEAIGFSPQFPMTNKGFIASPFASCPLATLSNPQFANGGWSPQPQEIGSPPVPLDPITTVPPPQPPEPLLPEMTQEFTPPPPAPPIPIPHPLPLQSTALSSGEGTNHRCIIYQLSFDGKRLVSTPLPPPTPPLDWGGGYGETVHCVGITPASKAGGSQSLLFHLVLLGVSSAKPELSGLSSPQEPGTFEIEEIISRLGNIRDTTLFRHLLPPTFTLRSAEILFQLLRGQPPDRRNFRKKLAHDFALEATGEKQTGRQRPAMIYRFKSP